MACVLVLNALHFGAKRMVKCRKMRDKKHKYPQHLYKQNLLEPWNTWLERAKEPLKSRVLGAKSGFLELKNYELATKLERQNGAKCRF